MAIPYESAGQQIGLTGSQTAPSFQPRQVAVTPFDPSRQMLQQSEQDLTAFSQFSDTLTSFLTDTAKKKNEEEYNLGISDVLNGIRTPTSEQTQQNQANVSLLRTAAEVDGQVAKDLADTGSLDVSQQFKAESKSISGWRSYGQAVGITKKVATDSQAFFMTWMENTNDKVIPTADGRMISPAEASTPLEIQAALELGQQKLISQSNIGRINPTILAEHLAPSIQAVKGQMYANKLSTEVRKAKETAISDTTGLVHSEFNNSNLDTNGMSESYQRLVSDLVIKGDLSRGAANDLVIKEALASISSLDEMTAKAQVAKLLQVRKIANDPNSITLGAAYPEEFSKVIDVIEGRVEQQAAKADRDMGKQAEKAWIILTKAQDDANMSPGDLKNLRQQTISVLGMLADKGSSEAQQYRTKLLSDPINIDYTLYRQYREGIAQGKQPTQEQIQRDVQSGKLSQEMGRELGVFVTTSDEGAFKKQFGSSISDFVKAGLKERQVVSLDPYNRPETHVMHVEQVTNDLVANVFRWRKSQLAKGQTPDDNDINQFVVNELPRTIGRYFQQNPNTKAWTTRPLSTNPSLTPDKIKSALSGPARDASGFNPRTIQLRSMNSGSSVLLSKEEVTDNINRFTNNQPLTRRAQQFADTTTGGAVTLLTQQAQHLGIDPTPIQNSPQAKQQAQYAAVAPWATQRLNASGGNYLQQMLNLQRIVEAQNRVAVRETNNATVSSISGQIDTTKAFNALVGKESSGNSQSLNTEGSGATGLGQVMPANIGPWTKEVLGRVMTQSEFRNNKAAQIRVVTYKFNQAIKSQLDAGFSPTEALRRAAAIWYSGDAKLVNSTKKEYYNGVAYPSIKEYADDILRRYNSY